MVNRETLLEPRSGLRSDALPATTIDFVFCNLNSLRQVMYSNNLAAAASQL